MSCTDDGGGDERCMCVCTDAQMSASEKLRRCCEDGDDQCTVRTSQLLTLGHIYDIALARRSASPPALRQLRESGSSVRLDNSSHRTLLQSYLGDVLAPVWLRRASRRGQTRSHVLVCDEHLRLLREPTSYARYLDGDAAADHDHPPLRRWRHDDRLSAEHARQVRDSLREYDQKGASAVSLYRRLAAQSEERRRRTKPPAQLTPGWQQLAALQGKVHELDDSMVATLGKMLVDADQAEHTPEESELQRLLPAVAKTEEERQAMTALLKTGEATGKPRVEAMRRQLVLAWLRHRSKHPAAAT